MKLLSTRARAKLWKLQDSVQQAANERNRVVRVLLHAHAALAQDAQHELWMEFSLVDQEYRFRVIQLEAFCERHGAEEDSRLYAAAQSRS